MKVIDFCQFLQFLVKEAVFHGIVTNKNATKISSYLYLLNSSFEISSVQSTRLVERLSANINTKNSHSQFTTRNESQYRFAGINMEIILAIASS